MTCVPLEISKMLEIVRCLRRLNVSGFSWTKQVCLVRRFCQENQEDDVYYQSEPERAIGVTAGAQFKRYLLKPDTPKNGRLLKVAVIGSPNSGKSTLTNKLMGWKVNPVSKKVHTTRENMMNVLTADNKQIIFTDTPGLVDRRSKTKYSLDEGMVAGPRTGTDGVDMVCVVVDVSNMTTRYRLQPELLQILQRNKDIASILVLNKVDAVKTKETLLDVTRVLTEEIVDDKPIPIVKSERRRKPVSDDNEFTRLEKKYGKVITRVQKLKEEYSGNVTTENDDDCFKDDSKDKTVTGKHTLSNMSQSPHCPDPSLSATKLDIRDRRGWPYFKRVFMVSALDGYGVTDLKEFLLQSALPGEWEHHSSLVTDTDPQQIACNCVWEKMLDYLDHDIPYRLRPEIVDWYLDEADDLLHVDMNIMTSNKRDMEMVQITPSPDQSDVLQASLLSNHGNNIQRIAKEAKQEMQNSFRCNLTLRISVRFKAKGKT